MTFSTAALVVALTATHFASSPKPTDLGRQTTPAVTNAARAVRVELHVIPTLKLTDEQFLSGAKAEAKPVNVAGELRIPPGSGRLPTVIMLGGSGGIGDGFKIWSDQFNSMGVATFVVDGLSGRGLASVSADQALLGRLNQIVDAYRALELLAKHARLDPSRIILMGFSRGGQATLYASVNRFHHLWNTSGTEFAAYVPFFPDCSTTYVGGLDLAARPVRIHHGTADDMNPIAPCKAYVDKLRGAGRDVHLTEYVNAHHGFDLPFASLTPNLRPENQTARHCAIHEDPLGRLIVTTTKQPFTYADPCIERGTHSGYNPDAARAAHQAVGELVKAVFKLP